MGAGKRDDQRVLLKLTSNNFSHCISEPEFSEQKLDNAN